MRRILRIGAAVVATAVLAGCQTKGQNLPLEEAMYRVPKAVLERGVQLQPEPPAVFPEEPIAIGNRQWLVTATEYELPADFVRPIGAIDGMTFYALAWDAPPFDRVLAPVPGRADTWQEFLEVY